MYEITKENLIEILSDHPKRVALLNALKSEQEPGYPLDNLYYYLAPRCVAMPEQLDTVVKSLLAYRHRFDRLLRELIYNRNMPESTLMMLLARRRFIDDLAHRYGPQSLLEEIARKFRISEAITSLAKYYYNRPEYPADAFAAFLREHQKDFMLRYNLRFIENLSDEKRRIIEGIFGDWQPHHR